MNFTILKITTMKFPNWIFPVAFLGFIRYPAIDTKIYALGVVAILWTYQDIFSGNDIASKIARYGLRTMAIAAMIASIFQPV
jgi:hypothetical protein